MKEMKENISLLSALILIIGTAKIYYFYSYFGIDIFSYIELTEIFTLSISFYANAMLFILPFVIFILQQALTVETRASQFWSKAFGPMQRSDIDNITPLEAAVGIVFWIGLLLSMISILNGYLDFTITYDMIIAFSLIMILPFISSYILPQTKLTINKIFKTDVSDSFLAFLLMTFFASFYAIGYSRQSARNVELKDKFIIAEVRFDSLTIRSTKSYRYVGKTKNYVFFYDKYSHKADAYSIENAKSISITNDTFFDGVIMKPAKQAVPRKQPAKVRLNPTGAFHIHRTIPEQHKNFASTLKFCDVIPCAYT